MPIYSLSDLRFITPKVLKGWITAQPSGNNSIAVVDVRDSDYIGGHIKGCLHYSSIDFHETLPELRQRLVDNKVRDVVFHCALSQVRGPKAALLFLRGLENAPEDQKSQLSGLKVWVLEGGFTNWQSEYGGDPELTEDYLKDLWI